jgi:hypothetical protein
MLAIVAATLYLPHGELVEPRTAALPSGRSAPSYKYNRGCLSTPCRPRLFYARPLHGNCFRSRSRWGEDRRLRWRVTDPLSGEVLSKGSPAGTMTGACWTSTVRAPDLAGRSPGRWRFRRGTDGIKKRWTGCLRIALLIYQDALRRPPVFPACKQWPDSEEGVAKERTCDQIRAMIARPPCCFGV